MLSTLRHLPLTPLIILLAMLAVVAMAWLYWRRVRRPIRAILNGMDLLREQDFSSTLRHVGQRDADRIVDMFNDMMSRLKNERLHIREQNRFLDLLIEASPMGVMVLDASTAVISMANHAASTFLGIDLTDICGKHLNQLDSPLAAELATLGNDEKRTVRLSDSMVYRCSRLAYMDQGYRHPFIMIELLTAEVARAGREAYERVLRMMAHEVNNSMAGVGSMLELAAADTTIDPDTARALEACNHRVRSMSEFVTSLASVVKIPDATTRPIALNTFMVGCAPVLESMLAPRGISLTILKASDDPEAQIDPVLMEQVIINLVKNSAESIHSATATNRADSHITIRLTSTPVGFIVEDNGPGISDEARAKLFTPFFSSKSSGRGLGLMLVADVLRKHQATFSLATSPTDHLTRFTVKF